jgi:hypothetical protein
VRKKHEYDPGNGGVAIPHIKDPFKPEWRGVIHTDVYLCSDLMEAMRKYRTAEDRRKWYGNRGAYSKICYLYMFDPDDTRRFGFQQLFGCEYYGKSFLPVKYAGCYRITWNEIGYDNIDLHYMQIDGE